MGEYSDAWREFRAIIATTEKKLLKKPNLPQAIQQLNALSLRLQDEDLPQHAAICHVEMAGFYQKLDQSNEQRKQYVQAAKLFMKAWREWKKGGSRGAMSIEAGSKMLECESYLDAEQHLTKALQLTEGDFFSQTTALNLLIQTYLFLRKWEELLTTVDSLWMMVMKSRSKTTLGQQFLRDCEVMSILVLRKVVATPSGRHKVLLETYGRHPESKKSNVLYKEGYSDLSQEEFYIFLRFLNSLDHGEVKEARQLLEQDLSDFISETVQKVVTIAIEEPFLSCDSF